MKTIGYNHGRFQPLHNGHFNTFLEILKRFDELWIGIANPLREYPNNMQDLDPILREEIYETRKPENNPYTYIERFEMIRLSLIDSGVDINRVRIMPHFGFYDCKNWLDFIPGNATIILAAKDYHHYEKIKKYTAAGFKVEFLEPLAGISGSIFDKEWPDGNWRKLVPYGTRKILEENLKKS